ncbi:unnamed protein product, partial [Effrenium voratum]
AQSYGGAYANFTKTFCGSYGYAAPEVNPRRQMHGFAADLYAFGILLVMMLTGGEVGTTTGGRPSNAGAAFVARTWAREPCETCQNSEPDRIIFGESLAPISKRRTM